jgi:pyruvate,orthophosphate dikinase
VLHEGDLIAIDGTTGASRSTTCRWSSPDERELRAGAGWADELRDLGVRANADTPEDARKARELGAEGIGLCRTEHMFMAEDRQPKMRAMIMAERRGRPARGAGRAAAAAAGRTSRGCSRRWRAAGHDPAARPAAARVPPQRSRALDARSSAQRIEHSRDLAGARAHARSGSGDLGGEPDARHPRLPAGILYPEIYEMQVHAILRAAKPCAAQPAHPEIMIPLVDYERELEIVRELVVPSASRRA